MRRPQPPAVRRESESCSAWEASAPRSPAQPTGLLTARPQLPGTLPKRGLPALSPGAELRKVAVEGLSPSQARLNVLRGERLRQLRCSRLEPSPIGAKAIGLQPVAPLLPGPDHLLHRSARFVQAEGKEGQAVGLIVALLDPFQRERGAVEEPFARAGD